MKEEKICKCENVISKCKRNVCIWSSTVFPRESPENLRKFGYVRKWQIFLAVSIPPNFFCCQISKHYIYAFQNSEYHCLSPPTPLILNPVLHSLCNVMWKPLPIARFWVINLICMKRPFFDVNGFTFTDAAVVTKTNLHDKLGRHIFNDTLQRFIQHEKWVVGCDHWVVTDPERHINFYYFPLYC